MAHFWISAIDWISSILNHFVKYVWHSSHPNLVNLTVQFRILSIAGRPRCCETAKKLKMKNIKIISVLFISFFSPSDLFAQETPDLLSLSKIESPPYVRYFEGDSFKSAADLITEIRTMRNWWGNLFMMPLSKGDEPLPEDIRGARRKFSLKPKILLW